MLRRGWIGRAHVLAVAMGFIVVLVSGTLARHDGHPLDPLKYVWLAAPALILLLFNRFPLSVFLVVSALVWGYFAAGYPTGPMGAYAIFAAFLLTLRRGVLVAGVAAAAALGASSIVGLIVEKGWPHTGIAFALAWTGMAIAGGGAVTARRNTLAARQEQGEERARRLAEEERLRIAREVHDVVAHSLAMINVQAGVGAHVADRRPAQAKEALLAIKEASRVALADLRATLAVLRGEDGKTPAPSLRRLAELTDATSATGLHVEVEGEPGELPAPVDTAAYRIVQESLTNAVRHARDATRITVRFARPAGGFEVVVLDDGSGSMDPGSGNGLKGMRERAEALGGTLTAEARPEGGFCVRAVLPVRGGEE